MSLLKFLILEKWREAFDAAAIRDPDKSMYVKKLGDQNIELDVLLQFDPATIKSVLAKYFKEGDVLKFALYVSRI